MSKQWNRGPGLLSVVLVLAVLLFSSRYLASTLLDYEWWREIHQLPTWIGLFLYGTLPTALAALLLFGCFVFAWRHGARRQKGVGLADTRTVVLISSVVLLGLALFIANATIDSWAVVRFFGSVGLPAHGGYRDPIFGQPLTYYFFRLPFYRTLLHLVFTGTLFTLFVDWARANFSEITMQLRQSRNGFGFEAAHMPLSGWTESALARAGFVILLLCVAVHFYLDRYGMLLDDHGQFLLGINYVQEHLVLPLQWFMVAGAIAAAFLVAVKKEKLAVLLLAIAAIRYGVPPIVQALYVHPNELAIERPYVSHHIEATRSAYGLLEHLHENPLHAQASIAIDYEKHKELLTNVRLWDWRAFHDTISQVQPLRPYAYFDTDVDRYTIDGSLRQLLVTPRELDVQQLGDAQNRWINPHLIYTHGYGVVVANANAITRDGLPQLLVENAPPTVNTSSLKLDRPQLYYGEVDQEPVYVSSNQAEFDFPDSSDQGHTSYKGPGGFPISVLTRLAAAWQYGDANILLTQYLNSSSRMMIHRRVLDRLSTAAGFVKWESDPYLVLREQGHLVWMVDGYMTSDSHPYSRETDTSAYGSFNYIRNSVKATVDAYTGELHLYIFDPSDPLIEAYAHLFPKLLEPQSAMPADLRRHARYPESLFSVQAEIYRAFHMRNPEAFYNRADFWDIAKTTTRNEAGTASTFTPTYVVATLPGEDKPEFLLLLPFTPANKDNLTGMMIARCDGPHLGEVVFQQLDKQNIIYGPKQIESFISQEQTISKDLTLWNQQGSEVLRGQMLVLPIENSFLYVEPIYIQASGARMPQLKKVAIAMGDHLAYADTYDQALTQLIGNSTITDKPPAATQIQLPAATKQEAAAPVPTESNAKLLQDLRGHLKRYQDLNAQGKYAEAGKELEEAQKLLNR